MRGLRGKPEVGETMSRPFDSPRSLPDLHLAERVMEGASVIKVAGDVDLDTVPRLRGAVLTALADRPGQLCVLDLTEVTFLGSAGLTVLVEAVTFAGAHHKLLPIVVDGNRPVIRPIEITGLDQVLPLYHSVGEAFRAARKP